MKSALVAALAVVGLVAFNPAPAAAREPRARAPRDDRYYLAIGASEAVGFQPVPGQSLGEPTDQGYANDLVAMEQHRWPGLQLEDLGCPGITAEGALHGTFRCAYPEGSEISTAVAALRAHAGETVLVTVDLGFNDIWPCLRYRRVDEACVTSGLARIARALPAVLADLRDVGGPHLLVVGLEHGDPFLTDLVDGEPAFARESAHVIDEMNSVLAADYVAAGAVVADVPATMGTTVPTWAAAQRLCSLTWMCRARNVHPDAAGYRAIADAIDTAISVPRAWSP